MKSGYQETIFSHKTFNNLTMKILYADLLTNLKNIQREGFSIPPLTKSVINKFLIFMNNLGLFMFLLNLFSLYIVCVWCSVGTEPLFIK